MTRVRENVAGRRSFLAAECVRGPRVPLAARLLSNIRQLRIIFLGLSDARTDYQDHLVSVEKLETRNYFLEPQRSRKRGRLRAHFAAAGRRGKHPCGIEPLERCYVHRRSPTIAHNS